MVADILNPPFIFAYKLSHVIVILQLVYQLQVKNEIMIYFIMLCIIILGQWLSLT